MAFQSEAFVDRDLLQLIWNNTNDAIFTIGYDGRILSTNPAFLNIQGWKKEDFQDRNMFSLFMNTSTKEHQHLLNTFKNGNHIPYYVTKRVRNDGKVLDILASYRSVNKEEILAVGMYKDFTAQMEIQRKLQASQYCYRNLVEFIPDAIFVETNGEIVFTNKPGIQIIGANSESEVLGQSLWHFILAEDPKIFKEKVVKSMKTGDTIIEKFKRLDGKILWAEITVMGILFEGDFVNQIMLRDITAKKNYEAKLKYLAFHDSLTGLSNRRYFTEQFNQAIEQAKKEEKMLGVMYIDLDKFKSINDSLGHEVGDQLLIQFANRLKENVREGDILCRMGGDEFLILTKINDKKTLVEIATRLHSAFQEPYILNDRENTITSSIGIAIYPEDGTDVKTLITRSDKALYIAKDQRNAYQFYEEVEL